MSDHANLRAAVEARFIAACKHLGERERSRRSITAFRSSEYAAGAKGAEMAELIRAMSAAERLALSEVVLVRDDVAAYCRATGKGEDDLRSIDDFAAFKAAKRIIDACSDARNYYAFVCPVEKEIGKQGAIFDVRFLVDLTSRTYQKFELVHVMFQMWEIFLRYQTNIELDEFSHAMRERLQGRVGESFVDSRLRDIVNNATPIDLPASPNASVEVLQSEIKDRLANIVFNLEERALIVPSLGKHKGDRSFDQPDSDAARERTRLLQAEKNALHELIYLRDSVKKLLDKDGRGAELEVIERLRPFRICANLANVLKHGIRGRNQECAVWELDAPIMTRIGDEVSIDDPAIDVLALVNYGGEFFTLAVLIEDLTQLWEMFLRHHVQVDLADFQVRLGKLLKSREGLATYSVDIPDGVKEWAKAESEKRKQLDLK